MRIVSHAVCVALTASLFVATETMAQSPDNRAALWGSIGIGASESGPGYRLSGWLGRNSLAIGVVHFESSEIFGPRARIATGAMAGYRMHREGRTLVLAAGLGRTGGSKPDGSGGSCFGTCPGYPMRPVLAPLATAEGYFDSWIFGIGSSLSAALGPATTVMLSANVRLGTPHARH